MTTTFALLLTIAFAAGSLFMLALFVLADWAIRQRHNLRTDADIDRALRAYEAQDAVP